MKDMRQETYENLASHLPSIREIIKDRENAKVSLRRVLYCAIGIAAYLYLPFIPRDEGWMSSPRGLVFQAVRAIGIFFTILYGSFEVSLVYVRLKLAYLGFKWRLLDYQLGRDAFLIKEPSLWYVLFKDLEAYEEELRAYVRQYRRNLQLWLREEKWAIAGEKLTRQLEAALRRFQLGPIERREIFERWEGILNPNGKKKYLSHLESKLAYREFSKKTNLSLEPTSEVFLEEVVSEINTDDTRVTLLENEASMVLKKESRDLFEKAGLETSRREKIRLYKQAIRLEEQSLKTEVVSTQVVPERKIADIHFLSLQGLARERFNLSGKLPLKVDPVMAREIILALLDPGRRGRRFQAAYRAEDTLKVMVRRQFEVYLKKQFDPRRFSETLLWLTNESVLFTKPKTDEQVYSLSSKTRGKSAEAQRVITELLAFDRSLRIM